MATTVEYILQILTPPQIAAWKQLIGRPFEFPTEVNKKTELKGKAEYD